jgi:hypothetical protein
LVVDLAVPLLVEMVLQQPEYKVVRQQTDLLQTVELVERVD